MSICDSISWPVDNRVYARVLSLVHSGARDRVYIYIDPHVRVRVFEHGHWRIWDCVSDRVLRRGHRRAFEEIDR